MQQGDARDRWLGYVTMIVGMPVWDGDWQKRPCGLTTIVGVGYKLGVHTSTAAHRGRCCMLRTIAKLEPVGLRQASINSGTVLLRCTSIIATF